jgi:hypothetical protein
LRFVEIDVDRVGRGGGEPDWLAQRLQVYGLPPDTIKLPFRILN